MTVTSVVFDLDGTLVDSSPDIAAALNVALAAPGVRQLSAAEVLAMLGGGPEILVRKALDAVGRAANADEIAAMLDAYTLAYRAHPVEKTAFFADAAETLAALHAQGLRLGVCTNKRTDIAERVLEHLGVRQFFGSVVGSDRASTSKPDPAHLLETLAELGTDPTECLYVGDTGIDADTARDAQVRYAHVAWGHPLDSPHIELQNFAALLPVVAAKS